jgi:NAD(P)-dependent dehydrogenase (short-subunit alcohol dehydrogenase family)
VSVWRLEAEPMTRVVVIASAEIGREALEAVLEPDDELHVLVPAVEQSRLAWLTSAEDDARAKAERVGEQIGRDAPAKLASLEVKPDSPSQVVRDAIAEHHPDRIVLALREGDEATWLEEAELDRLPSEIDGVPVTRLALTEGDA